MRLKRPLLTSLVIAAVSIGGACIVMPAQAQEPQDTENPATFSADDMTHDKELNVITARGHVEVNHADSTLLADSISYNQTTDTIRATGNVALHQPTGDILFGDVMEITGDLKNGMIEDLRAVMADRSRFAASQATLVNDETLTMNRALYSPCQVCKDDPSRPLLWQLKAVKVVHDRKNKVIKYTDAWMEVAGIPVVYTPYLSFPDPTVKRKSGFLTPSVGSSTDLGLIVKVPYFYAIDDHSDVTLTPISLSNEVGAVAGEYREKFTKGEISANGSIAYDSKSRAYGHIASAARFDIDRTWRWGADVNRSSSDVYMRRYGFGSDETLTSKLYMEGFRENSYASISAMSFQGLRADDDSRTIPMVLPTAQYSYEGNPDKYGAYQKLDLNVTALTREQGTDSTRISVKPSWNISHIAPKGDIYKLSATMGVDFFHAQSLNAPTSRGGTYNGAALRLYPELAFDWSWPMARRGTTVTEVFEPIAQVIVSPYGGNSYKMANEDSLDFDFNDANLFSTNRFTGYDRVESGPRANYGLKWSVIGDGGGSTSFLLGQSYRAKADDTFQVGSGLEDNFSDYVGKINITPGPHLNLLYRTRLDKDTLDFRRHELGANGTYSFLSYSTGYVFFDRQDGSEHPGRKELRYTLGSTITDNWSGSFSSVRDLSATGGPRSMKLNFIYDDECLTFDASFNRTFYQDREIRPTDSVLFRIVFKTLGEVTADVLSGIQ